MEEQECTVELTTQAVMAACSPDYTQVKQAERIIHKLEVKPGFHPILAEMSLGANVPDDAKRMAAICLKNGVTKFWRSMSPNALCKEDKERIKEIILGAHNVEKKEVFDQLLEVVGKVSRYDFPRNWPNFIPSLLQVIGNSPSEDQKIRALTMIYKVVKMLSTKRLSADKKGFRETTEAIFPIIGQLWENYLRLFNSQPTLAYLQPSCICLKIIRSMLTYGFEDMSVQLPKSCLEAVLNMCVSQLEHRLTISDQAVCQLYDKYLLVIIKVMINVQEKFPEFYGQYILVTLDFAYKVGFQYAELLEMRLVARALHLLSGIMLCETYDVFKLNNRGKNVSSISIKFTEDRNSFFTAERLKDMCVKCISKYLKMSEFELRNWQESPEEFAFEETRHVSLFNIKAASEHFLLNMTATFQEIVCPYIVELIKECAQHDRSNMETVLMIDSIYSVTVTCSYDLFDHIDIDGWFATLVQELAQETPYCSILRRRILEVIGRWVTIKLSQDKHTAVYEVCLQYMSGSQDLVVRLTAASALKAAVSDFAFYPPSYSPYLEVTMQQLYTLLREVEECESRVKILEVVNSIIDGCGKQIVDFVDPLIGWLPGLWGVATDHAMLQSQLLTTARKLSRCLGSMSVKLYGFTDPVLKYVLTQDPEMILLEDGITLWLQLLENAPCGTASFVQMFQWLYPLLQLGSDSLKTSLLIIECTILLDPPAIISRYGAGIVSACVTLYPEVVGEAKVLINNILLAIIKTVPRDQWPDLTPLLHVLLKNLDEFSDYSKVLTTNINVLCYLILLDLTYFNNLIASFNNKNLLKNILEIWTSKAEHFYQMEQHKLSLIALLTLSTFNPEIVSHHFVSIMNLIERAVRKCTLTFSTSRSIMNLIERAVRKCTDVDDKGNRFDCILRKHSSPGDDFITGGETEDYKRRGILEAADLIAKIDTITFLRAKFAELQRAVGPELFTKLSSGVDREVTDKLTSYLA